MVIGLVVFVIFQMHYFLHIMNFKDDEKKQTHTIRESESTPNQMTRTTTDTEFVLYVQKKESCYWKYSWITFSILSILHNRHVIFCDFFIAEIRLKLPEMSEREIISNQPQRRQDYTERGYKNQINAKLRTYFQYINSSHWYKYFLEIAERIPAMADHNFFIFIIWLGVQM